MGSVGEARCWRNGESTSSVQGHKIPTLLCSYKILYGKAFPDHVYKLHEMNCGERRGKRAEREERRGKKAEIMREESREEREERRENRSDSRLMREHSVYGRDKGDAPESCDRSFLPQGIPAH